MRRDLTIKTGNLAGTSDFRVVATIRPGLIPSMDAMTYKTRVKRVLRTLQTGRSGAHESELARVLSEAVERVGRIHAVGIAVLEPEDKVLLTVTFDGAWESYVRVIWQKVSRLLDLIFCNTEGYVLGYENTYADWGGWLKGAQTEASFLSTTTGVTVDDIRYLRMHERVYRREGGDQADLRATRIRIPSTEEIAERSIFEVDGVVGVDPTNAGFSERMAPEDAGRSPFLHGVRSLVGLYRLADVYPRDTNYGTILHRAAHELLPEFGRMVQDGNTYQLGIERARQRYDEAIRWFQAPADVPDVRRDLPVPLPDELPLEDSGNVQGGILNAYPDADHACLLLLQFASPAALAALLTAIRVTSEADSRRQEIATNIAFTVEGLRAAGLTDDEMRKLPEEFLQGMERRAGILGDLRINHPRRWRLPALNWHLGENAPDIPEDHPTPRVDLSAVHAVVQLRLRGAAPDPANPRAPLMEAMRSLVAVDAGVMPLSLQWMQRWRNDANKTVEHFGFVDTNSGPVLSPADAGRRFPNRIHLGEILCGYPNLADKASPYSTAEEPVRSLLHDGSFLVVRKLRQDIGAFEDALAEAVRQTVEAKTPQTREQLMAKMMGRWPGGGTNAGEPLAKPPSPTNDFTFDNDPQGSLCPFHAHIRRANPRTTAPEPGSRPARLVRRGMSYGPRHDRGAPGSQASLASLAQERGLIFMAYNASLGEQFEVVQRWLSGGNSSGSYSGQSDPLLGVAEPGRRRYFRFEDHEHERTIRVALDGSDRLHDEPRPFVRLEWGAYLLAPSIKALAMLQERAAAQRDRRPVAWDVPKGEKAIADLREIETRSGERAAVVAWKAALEDPDAAADFTSASIWAAIRERHGGVLKTPFGILVAGRQLVEQVFADPQRNLSITGYLPRMRRSFGTLYLGFDPGQDDKAYERESDVCNRAIMAIDQNSTFTQAREWTHDALQKLVAEAMDHARIDGEAHWELTLDARELIEPLLARFCEAWFGLKEEGGFFRRGGFRWDWKDSDPALYPGHFLSPSRYIFQPHPGPDVERIGAAHGAAVQPRMIAFLERFRADIDAPVTRAVLDSPLGRTDIAFVGRTIAGAMMGFIPTVEANLRRMLNEWLLEGTLWTLRARHGGTQAASFSDGWSRLGDDFTRAMQLRAVPELIWRTATVSHKLGQHPHQVDVRPGDIVVAGAVSATQQSLGEGGRDLHHAFGGNRAAAAGHPTHACPGMNPALGVMLGFFSALVESPWRLRAGPGSLTLALEGRLTSVLHVSRSPVPFSGDAQASVIAATDRQRKTMTTPLAAIGDAWLYAASDSLVSSLQDHGYDFRTFSSPGRLLATMASREELDKVTRYLRDPGDRPPKALLVGGGGNDVTHETPATFHPPRPAIPPPLAQLLQDPSNEAVIRHLVEGLTRLYTSMIKTLIAATEIPILIHAYDDPIPDGRPRHMAGPWLQPIFAQFGIDVSTPQGRAFATGAMQQMMERLNNIVAGVAAAHPDRVHHVKLTGTLAIHYGDDHTRLWNDELHPNKEGFDKLALVILEKLRALGIT